MAEQVIFTAGPVSRAATLAPGAAGTTSVYDWEWPAPKPRRRSAPGRYGSRALGPGDYEDRTVTLMIERVPGAGTAALSEAWLQSWAAVDGAVSQVEDALMRVDTAAGTSIWFEVLSIEIEPTNRASVEWNQGLAQAKVTVTARAVGYGSTYSPGGTMDTSSGIPVWTSSSAIPGDLPALLTISPTFTGADREWLATTCSGTVYAYKNLTGLLSSWGVASPVPNGAKSSSPLAGPVPVRQPVPVCTKSVNATGDFWVSLRMFVDGARPGVEQTDDFVTVQLLQDGRPIKSTSIAPSYTTNSAIGLQAWRVAEFGRVTLAGAHDLTVVIGGELAGSRTAVLDVLALEPANGAKATITRGDALAVDLLFGDEFGDVASGTLNGRSATYGGSWASSGWEIDGYAQNDASGGTMTARLGSYVAGGLTLRARVMVSAAGLPEVKIGFSSGSGHEVVLKTADPGNLWSLRFGGDGPTGIIGVPEMPRDEWLDVVLEMDGDGCVVLSMARAGLRPIVAARASWPDLVGATMASYASVIAGSAAGLQVQTWMVFEHLVPAMSWSSASRGGVVVGDLPVAPPGQVLKVIARTGKTEISSSPTPDPSAVSVTATPRYLQVPA